MSFRHVRFVKSVTFGWAFVGAVAGSAGSASAETRRYRLSWRDDPATTMVIGWEQVSGEGAQVHFGDTDFGTNGAAYPMVAAPARSLMTHDMETHFVRLSGLEPDTAYYFVVADSDSTSRRFQFRTAAAAAEPFTLIAGGDTRNHREPRRNGNRIVAQLRPLAVLLGGDFTDSNSDSQWQDWLDDWQETISSDGRL